jgi:hypothetical protein
MSFIGDLFSSGSGMGYNTAAQLNPAFYPQAAQLAPVTSQEQVNGSYLASQGGLNQQQAFLNALQAQNGIGNQSSVFAQQQGLANQLGQQAQGQGPNPALAQLSNTTGQNVSNQASLMASQRGASANTGLIARQAAQQGAGVQQQAAGQAAVMRAQQQLAAQQQLQAQQAQMAGLSTQQVGQQAGASQVYNQALQGQQQMLLNALSQHNQANVGMQGNINSANAGIQQSLISGQAGIAGVNAQAQGNLIGGTIGGAGAAMMAAHGGMVKGYAEGGEVSGPQSFAGKFLKGFGSSFQSDQPPMFQAGQTMGKGLGMGMNSLFSPQPEDQSIIPQNQYATAFSRGGMSSKNLKSGGKVPGQAKVSGDNLKNDTVPAMLSPKEIVIPRSITMSEDAPEKAAKFVAAILAREGMRKK